MNQVSLRAFAKINLLLDITERLPNGYHALHMIMQSVGLYDEVTVTEGARGIECDDPAVPTDERNIAWKAVDAFAAATGVDCSGTRILLKKHIPSALPFWRGSICCIKRICPRTRSAASARRSVRTCRSV